jgi:uncharacterized membrane protein YeaQ/YmgE (transglycosylase-associated protein family)
LELIWMIVVGFAVGVLAKFAMRGDNKPRGFVLTTLLGIAGAFVGTFLGQFVGYLNPGEQGSFITSVIGAVAVLAIWALVARKPQAG